MTVQFFYGTEDGYVVAGAFGDGFLIAANDNYTLNGLLRCG